MTEERVRRTIKRPEHLINDFETDLEPLKSDSKPKVWVPLLSVTTINITSSLRSYKVNLIKEKRNKVFSSSSSTSSLIEAAAAASNLSI